MSPLPIHTMHCGIAMNINHVQVTMCPAIFCDQSLQGVKISDVRNAKYESALWQQSTFS